MSLCLLTRAEAHDSPEHSVEELTAHIKQEGATVPLLLSRATHHRVLGKVELATADLLRVLQIEPQQCGALVELCRIHLAKGDYAQSMRYISQAIKTAKSEGDKQTNENIAHLFAARGDVFSALNDYRSALKDYDQAIAEDKAQVEWYLNRSRVQEFLQLREDRIKGLQQGHRSTLSAVLYSEWVEALIDGGQAVRALSMIEPQLVKARLKSSWLIRRARARLSIEGKPEYSIAAQSDLQAAIVEINTRLRAAHPDLDLLLDRALAHLLSGDVAAARNDYLAAQKEGATLRQLEKLQHQLGFSSQRITANK